MFDLQSVDSSLSEGFEPEQYGHDVLRPPRIHRVKQIDISRSKIQVQDQIDHAKIDRSFFVNTENINLWFLCDPRLSVQTPNAFSIPPCKKGDGFALPI